MKIFKIPYKKKSEIVDWLTANDFELHKDFEFEFHLDTLYSGYYKLSFQNKEAEFWYSFNPYE